MVAAKTSATAKDAVKPRAKREAMVAGDRDDRYFSRAVGKSFELLRLLNRASVALSLNQLSVQVGLTRSSAFRLLHTLQVLRYVKQDSEGRYAIAAENWISTSVQATNALIRIAKEPARALNLRFQETVSLAVLYSNHIEVVQVFESPRVIRMANTLGGIIPPHTSSLGKSITAFQVEQVQLKLIHGYGLRRFTEHTTIDEVALLQELTQIREQGFAREEEETFPDGCCIGCPIFAGGETAVAAISISMPKFRMPQGLEQNKMISGLQDTARKISEGMKSCMCSY